MNPNLSVWVYLFGNHNFNKYHLVSPGNKVIVHDKLSHRKTWAYHGEEGYYIVLAKDHYYCIKCYIPKTHTERVTDTATLLPNRIPIPKPSLTDHIRSTTDQLIYLLLHKEASLVPYLKPTTNEYLLTLARLLYQDKTSAIMLPPLPSSPTK